MMGVGFGSLDWAQLNRSLELKSDRRLFIGDRPWFLR